MGFNSKNIEDLFTFPIQARLKELLNCQTRQIFMINIFNLVFKQHFIW